jgi:hypothetical protein
VPANPIPPGPPTLHEIRDLRWELDDRERRLTQALLAVPVSAEAEVRKAETVGLLRRQAWETRDLLAERERAIT